MQQEKSSDLPGRGSIELPGATVSGPVETIEDDIVHVSQSSSAQEPGNSPGNQEIEAAVLYERTEAMGKWHAAQQARLKELAEAEIAPGDSGRVLTADEVEFVHAHWRPLLTDEETEHYVKTRMTEDERFLLEARIASQRPNIDRYAMRDPNIQQTSDHTGLVILKKLESKSQRAFILEGDSLTDSISRTIDVTKFLISNEKHPDITENSVYAIPASEVDHFFHNLFAASYGSEMNDSRAWYFGSAPKTSSGDEIEEEILVVSETSQVDLLKQHIDEKYAEFKQSEFAGYNDVDSGINKFTKWQAQENITAKLLVLATAYATATGKTPVAEHDLLEVHAVADQAQRAHKKATYGDVLELTALQPILLEKMPDDKASIVRDYIELRGASDAWDAKQVMPTALKGFLTQKMKDKAAFVKEYDDIQNEYGLTAPTNIDSAIMEREARFLRSYVFHPNQIDYDAFIQDVRKDAVNKALREVFPDRTEWLDGVVRQTLIKMYEDRGDKNSTFKDVVVRVNLRALKADADAMRDKRALDWITKNPLKTLDRRTRKVEASGRYTQATTEKKLNYLWKRVVGRDQTREEAAAEMFNNSRFSALAVGYREEKPDGKRRPSFGGENIGMYDGKVYFVVDQALNDPTRARAVIVRIPVNSVDLMFHSPGTKVTITVNRQGVVTVVPRGTSVSRTSSFKAGKSI